MSCRSRRAALVFVLASGPLAACGGSTPRPVTQPAAGAPARLVAPAEHGEDAGAARAATALLSGTVAGSDTATPLGDARVILWSPALAEPRVTISHPDGSFEFASLPAGTYTLSVTRTGYAARRSDESPGPATPLTLADGQHLTGLSIALVRAGVIAGTLRDPDNRPLQAATVDALVARIEDGRPTFVSLARGTTDERGDFRLSDLPAGQYYLSAINPPGANAGRATGPQPSWPTYYPGVALADEARPLDVASGVESPPTIVFKLQTVRPAHVSGTIHTQDRRQLLTGAVIMDPVRGEDLLTKSPQDVRISADGSFVFSTVPPGRYQIRGRGEVEGNGMSLFALYTISVEGHDIDNIDMTLVPGTGVAGRLIVDPAARPPSLAGVRVHAPFVDGSGFGDSMTGDVRPDGSFHIRGVMAGSHLITVEGLRSPWLLKSVLHRGVDITDRGFQAEGRQSLDDLQVTVTNVATEISGTVRDASGAPAPDAVVLLIPTTEEFWTRTSRHVGIVRAGADGRYLVRGLPSGEYRAVASLDLEDADAHRHPFLRNVIAAGRRLMLQDRDARVLDLAITSAALLRPASAR